MKLSDRVLIAFDSDAATNPSVATQERKLALYLRSMGANVLTVRIPPTATTESRVWTTTWRRAAPWRNWWPPPPTGVAPDVRRPTDPRREQPRRPGRRTACRTRRGTNRRGVQARRLARVRAAVGEDGYIPLTDGVDDTGARRRRPGAGPERAPVRWPPASTPATGATPRPGTGGCTASRREVTSRLIESADDLTSVRRLSGVVHAPMLRPDLTVLDEPGYDPATRLLYLPEPSVEHFRVPNQPTPAELAGARDLLLDLIADFPFVTDDDRINVLAAARAPILQRAVGGTLPLLVINAPMFGTGKTLLSSLLRRTHGGVHRTRLPDDADEVRKQITAS